MDVRYHVVKDKEWVQPNRKKYYMKCCDCGLVHRLKFRLVKYAGGSRGKIQFQADRLRKR